MKKGITVVAFVAIASMSGAGVLSVDLVGAGPTNVNLTTEGTADWVTASDRLTDSGWQEASEEHSGSGGELQINIPIGGDQTKQIYRLTAWRQ